MRRAIASLAAMICLVAQPAQAEPSARSMELARRYVASLNMEELMVAMVTTMAVQSFEAIAKARDLPLTNEIRNEFSAATEESVRAITPKMMAAMLPAVAEHFTEAELGAAVAYLETPMGQAFMKKSPQLMPKVQAAVNPLTPEFEADLEKRFCARIGCDAEAAR